jgi:hypothetical protein
MRGWPPVPGPGRIPLPLTTPSFYILVALIGLFALMLWYLSHAYPGRRRAMEGYFEGAGISLGFLALAVLLVLALGMEFPRGNRTSWALYTVVLSGYWLTFAIPIVSVASSVESRSRGKIPWVLPSILLSIAMFAALFAYYFYFVAAPAGQ